MEIEFIFKKIDELILEIGNHKSDLLYTEIEKRKNTKIPNELTNNEILKKLSYLIAYSQNANSESVYKVLQSGKYDKVFLNFNSIEVAKLNPCDIADENWEDIKGIRQQAKLFHIVSLSRKINKIGSFYNFLQTTNIPTKINSKTDIDKFWNGFNELLDNLKTNKIPFFQSTTSLLHFLLDIGYDCIKPDLAVMNVAVDLQIVPNDKGDKNLREVVKFIQEYSISRNVKPTVVDLYFLIRYGQAGAKKYVTNEYKFLKND